MKDVLVPEVRFWDCEVKVIVVVYDSVLVLVTFCADKVSLGARVEPWLVKELWTVKFNDTVPPVVPCGPVSD